MNIFYKKNKYLYILYFIIIIIFFNNNINDIKNENILDNYKNNNSIITENFFIIDSNNLESVQSHFYGYSITKNGILTDNYYKELGFYEKPSPEGVYVMVLKTENEIKIYQDYFGSYGIYLYQNKNKTYFALSNSFLLIEEHLVGKQSFTLNKIYADNFIIAGLCTPSLHETLIKEIIKISSDAYISINIKKRRFKIKYINYKENSVLFPSEEGFKIIDQWADKWGYILRSLKNKTINIYSELSGGFDSRTVLAILLKSGIDYNNIKIISINDKLHHHDKDYEIAKNISLKYKFDIYEENPDKSGIILDQKNSLYCSIYTKLGIHKELKIQTLFYNNPRFELTGFGGENIRGHPGLPIKKYIYKISYSQFFKNLSKSSARLCRRSIYLLKKKIKFKNDYEISAALYKKGRARNHFGKVSLEAFLVNIYYLSPLLDSYLLKIKFDIEKYKDELISYIFLRFAPDLILFPFDRNKTLNIESINKAREIIKNISEYKSKTNFNENFYIDRKRMAPINSSNIYKNADDYIYETFNSKNFIRTLNKLYDLNIIKWIKEYTKNAKYYPLRHVYGLYAIEKSLEYIDINEKLLRKRNNIK